MTKEKRYSQFETRENEDGTLVMEGYALKFERESENLGGFIEVLDKHCLNGADVSNVVALYNHDPNLPLARSTVEKGKPGSLDLEVDETGLKFRLIPTDTTFAQDLRTNMLAGVINKCSFAFEIDEKGAEWKKDKTRGIYVRTVKNIRKLWDVSIVTTPAYDDTECQTAKREFVELEKERQRDLDLRLRLLNL